MWQCSTLIFKYSCGSSVLGVVESREMTEQTDWWAKQTIRSGLHLRRSDEVLRSLWQYLRAQDQGHPIIICLERSVEKRQRSTTYLERMRQGYQSSIGTVSKATLGKLRRDEVECICDPPARNESKCCLVTFEVQPISQRGCHTIDFGFSKKSVSPVFSTSENTLLTCTESL